MRSEAADALRCRNAQTCVLLVLRHGQFMQASGAAQECNTVQYGTAHVQNSTVPVLGGSDLRCAALQTPCYDLWMLQVWQVRASYDAKPYRKTMMQLWCELGGGGGVSGERGVDVCHRGGQGIKIIRTYVHCTTQQWSIACKVMRQAVTTF